MSNKGWISLHRKIQNHWLYTEKRVFSKFEAWIDILMMANHQENKVLLGNELLEVERGSFITSELKLMQRWKWSKTKLRNFLKILEEDEMIIKKSDKKKTTLIICNYNDYQPLRDYNQTTEIPQENQEETMQELQEDTNNNDNNDNNDNNISSCEEDEIKREPELKFPVVSTEYRLADYLRKHILKNNPKARVPDDENMDKWAQHIDYMLRLDKRDPEDIKAVIEFCQKDNFWMTNILSTAKLRKQFDQLYLKSKQVNKQQNPVPKHKKHKTKFHLAESRGDNYTADEIEELLLRKQKGG